MTDVMKPLAHPCIPESLDTNTTESSLPIEQHAKIYEYQVDPNEFARVDDKLLAKFSDHIPYNAIHGTLSQHHSYISRYEIYVANQSNAINRSVKDQNASCNTDGSANAITEEILFEPSVPTILCITHIGDRLCGHPGIVHGGIISALFDNTFGWLLIMNSNNSKRENNQKTNESKDSLVEKSPIQVFTANLSVNYRLPVYANNTAVIKAEIKSVQGRKIMVSATWEIGGKVHADATALFIIPKSKI